MTIYDDADVNPPRPAFGHEYKKAMPWLHDETQFACEGCGDLVALEKAKLRDDIRDSIRLGTACETLQEVSQSRAYLLSEGMDIRSLTAVRARGFVASDHAAAAILRSNASDGDGT